jgi:DNA polymerase
MLREMGVPAFWPVEPSPEPDVGEAAASRSHPAGVAEAAPRVDAPIAAPARASEASSHAMNVAEPTLVRPAPPATRPAAGPLTSPAASPNSRAAPPAEVALGPRPTGIETMDWPALRAAVASCQACPLSQSRTHTVFGVGHIEADWMIVGEAPGEQEDKQGEPFVGRAGELLDRMLEAVGLTRAEAPATQQVFIANVLKCRPPANRNPLPPEVAQCEPYLLRQMALVQPRVVLAMGRFAVQSLLKSSEPLGKLRGRVHQVQGVPVIVTYHPAYLLRSPADKALAWDDLCLAREVLMQSRAQSRA